MPILSNKKSEARFWGQIQRGDVDSCWLWTGRRTRAGYGVLAHNGKQTYAHRYCYEYHVHSFQEDLLVCHHCDNPSCVNPAHLFVGTQKDNMQDMSRKGRHYSVTKPELVPRGDRNGARTKPHRRPRGEQHGLVSHPERAARGDKNGARVHIEKMARGEANGNAALTEQLVRKIRAEHAEGGTQRGLARKYNVSQCAIGGVVHRMTWRHVV